MADDRVEDTGFHYASITAKNHETNQTQPSSPASASLSQPHTHSSQRSHKEQRDPNLDVNLPYRTLSANANLSEYVEESADGEIPGALEQDGKMRYKMVTFTPGDPGNPKNWSKAYKWYCTMVVAFTCFVVAFASAVITADLKGVEETFDVSEEVALLTITVFVIGFGIGRLPKGYSNPQANVLQRSYGVCPSFRSSGKKSHLWLNVVGRRYFHYTLRRSAEYWNTPCVSCNRWNRILSTDDLSWRFTSMHLLTILKIIYQKPTTNPIAKL